MVYAQKICKYRICAAELQVSGKLHMCMNYNRKDTPIAYLAPGQRISVVLIAMRGTVETHAKWTPCVAGPREVNLMCHKTQKRYTT